MQRDYYIDVIAGLMIIVMVLTHTYDERMQIDILNFFMPWFFFKSGMYFKEDLSIRKTIIDGVKKLLYPFITFSVCGYVIYVIKIILEKDTNLIHYTLTPLKELCLAGCIEGNLPLWFLFVLFIVRLLYKYIYIRSKHSIVCNLVITAILIYIVIAFNEHPYCPLYITTILTGTFFYGCGHILRNTHCNTKLWSIACVIFVVVYILDSPSMIMHNNNLTHGHYILWFIFSLSGCIMINGILKRITFTFPVLHWIGINSMVIYVTHYLVIGLFDIITKNVLNFELTADLRLISLIATIIIAEFFIVHGMNKECLEFLLRPNFKKQ